VSAYVIAVIEVTDPRVYEDYKQCAAAAIQQYGGRYIVRGGQREVFEGDSPAGRVVVLQFPSLEAAHNWYHSEEYQACATIRHRSATSTLFAVDGV
jgi:uncharacterized protein (DUF1330 family)